MPSNVEYYREAITDMGYYLYKEDTNVQIYVDSSYVEDKNTPYMTGDIIRIYNQYFGNEGVYEIFCPNENVRIELNNRVRVKERDDKLKDLLKE